MTIDLYTTNGFQGLSREEQIGRCRAMAIEARRLAANGAGEQKRGEYSNLAERWTALADEMEDAKAPPREAFRATDCC